jgi:hypothetical protein
MAKPQKTSTLALENEEGALHEIARRNRNKAGFARCCHSISAQSVRRTFMEDEMSDATVRVEVPLVWSSDMCESAWLFAKSMTDDREKQAYIVGVLHMAWTPLIMAGKMPFSDER